MINVRINTFPHGNDGGTRPATTKVFLGSSEEERNGCRPLEPGEVVALDEAYATKLLAHLPNELVMTLDPPTRPLFFKNADEARLTSQFYNPATAGRADEAKAAMTTMMEQANSEGNQATVELINELEAREAAIRAREIELGMTTEPTAEPDEIDDEDYIPSDNVVHAKAVKDERDKADAAVETVEPPRRRRRTMNVA